MAPPPTTATLDAVAAIRHYIDRIVVDLVENGSAMGATGKILLLDTFTTQVVSAVYSQTEILAKKVYLVKRIDEAVAEAKSSLDKATVSHLHAIVFVRPTLANVEYMGKLLPLYRSFHVVFSNNLSSASVSSSSNLLDQLAQYDVSFERIHQVHEFYADYLPVSPTLAVVPTANRSSIAMSLAAGTSWAPNYASQYERTLQGIASLLLSFRRQPSCIRYASHSACAEEVAKDLQEIINNDEIHHFKQRPRVIGNHNRNASGASAGSIGNGGGDGLHVLILDRRDDPVTPLLSQWTYQAMVHELLGLNNHVVSLKGAPNVAPELQQVVLNPTLDDFYANNWYKNFGELGEEIQRLLQDYQRQTAQSSPTNLGSIEEMQQFVMEKFPELRSKSHVVSKHVAIMGELARLVEVCHLMDVSQLEQELACGNDDAQGHWRDLLAMLQASHIKVPDKLRLGLLYALRYENQSITTRLQSCMSQNGVPPEMCKLVPTILKYGGRAARGPGLYNSDNNALAKMTKSFITSVQGIQNVYAQHEPLLMETIASMIRNKLSLKHYPMVSSSQYGGRVEPGIPDEILVFIVGGVTYEEALKVHELNNEMRGRLTVLLAGSTVHNSTSFLEELKSSM